jgi:serine/threonine protein kinase
MSNIKSYKEKYTKIKSIDSGGQGYTFLAVTKDDSKELLIKRLKRQDDDERRARMYREVVAMETLNNEYIPKIIDSNAEFYKDKDYELFIAMEFIEGETLYSFVDKKHDIQLEALTNFIKILLDSLNYCHSNGIVHRDIKPDNIILKNNNINSPILIDFGLSFNNENNEKLTEPEQILGNRFLFLPELGKHSENKNDIRADITMVVGLVFFLITGLEPGQLVDENGKLPHQRNLGNISESAGTHLKLFSYFFDIGFQGNIKNRFQSINEATKEIDYIIQPKQNLDKTEEKLKEFKTKRFTSHVEQTLEIEKKMKRTLTAFIESFEKIVHELDGSVYLIRIKNHFDKTTCWSAYTIQDKIKSNNRISLKLEAIVTGHYVLISGGEVELHGIYVGEKDRIQRINLTEIESLTYETIFKYLIEKVLNKYEL